MERFNFEDCGIEAMSAKEMKETEGGIANFLISAALGAATTVVVIAVMNALYK